MRTFLTLFVVVILLIPGSFVFGATSASVQTFLPAIDDSRYLSVYGSQTLQRWQFRTGIYLNYEKNPLEIGITNRRAGLINDLVMADIFGALGITDWLQLGLDVPVAVWGSGSNFLTGADKKFTRLGDILFEPKIRFVDIDRYKIGVALVPYLTAPTGDGNLLDVDPAVSSIGRVGVGNNSFTGGGKLVVDVDILRRAQIALNLGYLARSATAVFNTRIDDQFTYGLGANIIAAQWFHIIFEATGATLTEDFFKNQNEIPFEIAGGFRFFPPQLEGLQLTVGGGAGMTFGYGSPDFRGLFGVSYMKPRRVSLPPPPPIPEEEVLAWIEKSRIIITKKVHFEFDKAIIRPVSFRILDAVADILKENPEIHKVRVEGHTDFLGTDAYNLKLSQRRANAVQDYLVKHGISANRLTAVGYGESRPVATNETAPGRARNRRVEFIILEQTNPFR